MFRILHLRQEWVQSGQSTKGKILKFCFEKQTYLENSFYEILQ